MSTIGIVQIHDVIAQHRGNYCCICFCPAVERKLVEPVYLKTFISKLITAKGLKNKIQVCYICEGLALSAVRFVKAVELASRVSELFTIMDPTQWRNILNYINEPNSVPKGLSKLVATHKAIQLERSLRSTPRYELRRTDTLVVPSPPRPLQDPTVVMQHANSIIPTALTPAMPIMAPGAPRAPVMTPRAPVAPPVSIMSPTPPTLASLRNQKISVDQDLKVVKVVNNETKQIILHPMVQGLDGNVYVPSLHLQILDNGLLKSVTNVPNSSQMSPPTLIPANPQNDTKLRNILQKEQNAAEKNKEKSDYYNFLVSQMEQKQSRNAIEIIKMNDLNIVIYDDEGSKKKRKRREGSAEKMLSEVQLLLNKNAEGSCEVKYEIIDDDEDGTRRGRIEPPAKEPVERMDRTVDWEDKIPMDVISFMDATDPNPEERIMQPPPLGFISDVRTVPNETIEHIECIDLC